MLAFAAAALAYPPEGAISVLGAPPPVVAPGPLPPGARFAPRERPPMQVAAFPPPEDPADVVRLLGEAPDGAVVLAQAGTVWTIAADGNAGPPWPHVAHPRPVVAGHGRWWVPTPEGLEIRDRDGQPVTRAPTPCPAPAVFPVDGGARVVCHGRPSFHVAVDGTVHERPSTLTLPDGTVLTVGPWKLARPGAWTVDLAGAVLPSPDGRLLLVRGEVVDAASGERLPARGERWTADGDLAVGALRYDPATGLARARPDGHGGRVTALAWSLDGRWLASAGEDGAVLVWDPTGGPPLARLDAGRRIRALRWDDLGGVLVTWADGFTSRWVPGEPAPRFTVRGSPALLPGGRLALGVGTVVRTLAADGAVEAEWPCPVAPPAPDRGDWGASPFVADGRLYTLCGGLLLRVGRDRPLELGVAGALPLPNGTLLLARGGGQHTPWRPRGRANLPRAYAERLARPELRWSGAVVPPPPAPRGIAAVAPDGRVATANEDGAIWLLAPGPTSGRRPRWIAIVGPPAGLPDPERVIDGLRLGWVPGDRVTWVPFGATEDPPWIAVDDPSAARRLARIGRRAPSDGDAEAAWCRALALLGEPSPEHERVAVRVGWPSGSYRNVCPAGGADRRGTGDGAAGVVSVRPGW